MENAGLSHQEKVAAKAYQIYLAEGCPEGRADEHWARAEREICQHFGPLPVPEELRPKESAGEEFK